MKRLFSLLMVLTLAAALCLPVWADDSNPDSGINNGGDTSTVATDNQGVYVTGYTVTTPAGGEITTLNVGDQVNIVLQVVDHSSARYAVKAEDIVARINSSIFTYTGTGEIGQLFESNDDPDQTRKDPQYNYYSYVLLFRDVIYNGGGNTLPINLSYLDTSKPLQQFSVTLGQCVDKDQATTPNLIVRTSNYGDAVTAGTAFTLSLGLYATDGNEALNDVIVSLTLPENISLGDGSLSNYVGSMAAKSMQNITFSVLPAAGFTGTVADITVNMTGTGAISGKAVSSTTAISVPISQPDRFEVGQLQLSSESIMVGETGSVTLSYVNKGKNAIGNLEARLTGTNLGGENYQYLGNLNAGTEGSVDFDITPDAAGNISGVITLNYEDASGNPRTISKDFTATAEEMNYDDYMPDPDSNVDEPQQTGMPVWGWVLIVVCVGVVVAVIVVVVLRKRKKAKALAALDEDSDEDI